MKDQRKKGKAAVTTLLSEYKKFHFLNKADALKAKRELERKYPDTVFKVSNAGSLFAKHNGSLLFNMRLSNDVAELGGVDA